MKLIVLIPIAVVPNIVPSIALLYSIFCCLFASAQLAWGMGPSFAGRQIFAYSISPPKFLGADLTLLSQHLTFNFTIYTPRMTGQ